MVKEKFVRFAEKEGVLEMDIKVLYEVSFSYDDSFNDPIWFFGEFKESISESLESLFLKMDGLDKDHATNYFPDCVDIHTKKSVIIEGEEYFTNRSNSQILIRLNC